MQQALLMEAKKRPRQRKKLARSSLTPSTPSEPSSSPSSSPPSQRQRPPQAVRAGSPATGTAAVAAPTTTPSTSASFVFASTNTANSSQLLYLDDDLQGLQFLVDTGAAVSLYPHQSADPVGPRRLRQADGSALPSWGRRQFKLRFGGIDYEFSFLLAAVDRPILGVDFLNANKWIVDIPGRQILDSVTMRPIFMMSPNENVEEHEPVTSIDAATNIQTILDEFPEVVGATLSDIKPQHGVTHHIVTSGPPVHARYRRLDAVKYAAAKAEFTRMEKAGIIRRSSSPWSSPLHMVQKQDGSWRPCGDYRLLNAKTVPDRYPVPNVHDLSARLHGCKFFTKLDLVKGYYQVPMHPDDIPKTCVVTPFGAYEWLFMPFGLRNAGNTFQRMMDRLGVDLPFVFIYLDDILIASPDMATHERHIRQVLERLRQFGLIINPAKCLWAKKSVPFLGHEVTAGGITPLDRHVDAVKHFPTPTDVPSLQRFLGLVNYFRRFIPAAASLLAPLTDALKSTAGGFTWTPAMEHSFAAAKDALTSATVLRHPDQTADVSLAVDASSTHVGGVLQQWDVKAAAWAPLGFWSKKLGSAERNYSTFDRELLAVYLGIRHFRFALEGRQFTLFTDHKPVVSALTRVTPPVSARQQRHLSYISEFAVKLVHLPGAANCVADALSRPVLVDEQVAAVTNDIVPSSIDVNDLAAAQVVCSDCRMISNSPKFQVMKDEQGVMVSLAHKPRILLPVAYRRHAFDEVHGLAHPGSRATKRMMSDRFLWPGMAKDITAWVKCCLDCQRSKIHRHSKSPTVEIPIPVRRFDHIHVDLVGALHESSSSSYLLTIVDR